MSGKEAVKRVLLLLAFNTNQSTVVTKQSVKTKYKSVKTKKKLKSKKHGYAHKSTVREIHVVSPEEERKAMVGRM